MFAAFVEMLAVLCSIKGLHLFRDVVNYTVCECAPFCTVLFVFCLVTKCPRIVDCWEDRDCPSVALVVVFLASDDYA